MLGQRRRHWPTLGPHWVNVSYLLVLHLIWILDMPQYYSKIWYVDPMLGWCQTFVRKLWTNDKSTSGQRIVFANVYHISCIFSMIASCLKCIWDLWFRIMRCLCPFVCISLFHYSNLISSLALLFWSTDICINSLLMVFSLILHSSLSENIMWYPERGAGI